MSHLHYWPIEEFAQSVLGSASKHKAVAVLVGYFDESGISANDHIALTGGAVADSMTWATIERPWKKWLSAGQFCEREISCFHAVDCEHGQREFFPMERPLREALSDKLSDEIGKIQPRCFAAGVVRKDWGYASAELKAAVADNPFYLTVALCMEQISNWSQEFADGEPVAMVFARQKEFNAATAAIHSEYFGDFPGIGAISFAEPSLVIPLQVADFIAYESYRYDRDSNANRRFWKNLERHGVSMDYRTYDKENLPKLVPSS